MATVANTNYGTLLKKGSTVLGEITVLQAPEFMNETVEATSHASGGWKEYISGGLKGVGEVNFTCNMTNVATVSGMMTDLSAGTKASYNITFPNTTVWTFDAFVVKFQPQSADAQSPEALKADVSLQPTGTMTIA